jgi:hypothetical protein
MKNNTMPTEGENSQKTSDLAGLPVTPCCASSFDGAKAGDKRGSFSTNDADRSLLRSPVIGAEEDVDHRGLGVSKSNVGNVVNVDPDFHRLPGSSADSILIVDAYNLGKGHYLIGLVELLREAQAKQWAITLRELVSEGFDILDLLKNVGEGISGKDWSMKIRGPLLEIFLHNAIGEARADTAAPHPPKTQ